MLFLRFNSFPINIRNVWCCYERVLFNLTTGLLATSKQKQKHHNNNKRDKRGSNLEQALRLQSCSIPYSLVKMISMIFEGGEPSRELSAGLQKVSVNLSQIIRFNSLKQKCQEKHRNFATSKTTNHRYQFWLV